MDKDSERRIQAIELAAELQSQLEAAELIIAGQTAAVNMLISRLIEDNMITE